VQPNLNDSSLDSDHFDIAAVRLNIWSHQVHHGANARQQCIAVPNFRRNFAAVGV
jgi:hypothetical protein